MAAPARVAVAFRPSNEQPKSREGLRAVLTALGWEWRYNVRSARAELRESGGPWRETDDRLICDIRAEIPLRFVERPTRHGENEAAKPLAFGRTAWEDSFSALLHRAEADPFQDWLESLPAWDRAPRLDSWLATVFHVRESGGLAPWCSRFLPLGAVWRTYRPGTKLDEMPVLIGPQGAGKSTALRCLLPPEHPEWFSDGLRLSADDKVRAEALQGRVIVEASEMAGATRAERESLKAFLSRTDDGSVRLAYRRNPETMLRRCVLAGSTNDPHCLPADPSGNRRFVVVTVEATGAGPAGVQAYLKANREQLWVEALHRYHEGETAWLPPTLADAQTEANHGAVQVDETLEDAMLEFLDGWPDGELFRLADMKMAIQPRLTSDHLPSDRQLSVELHRLGCESLGLRRINGQRGRWWGKPLPF